MCSNQKRVLMKAFLASQSGYRSSIWTFHSRGADKKANNLHERLLQIVYKGNITSFEDLRKRDKSSSIFQKNINH